MENTLAHAGQEQFNILVEGSIDLPATVPDKFTFITRASILHKFRLAGCFLGRVTLVALISAVSLLLFFVFAILEVQHLQLFLSSGQVLANEVNDPSENEIREMRQRIAKSTKNHQKLLAAKVPRSPYLIINTTENRFYLRSGTQILRTGFCSTGSLTVLKKSDEEKWAFQTPRGVLNIRSKTVEPVWKKPDWAFIEEGLPIPRSNDPSRYDYSTLGDYALNLGNGYLIHGTLYQRLLGMPVTHGCIRLGDDDLKTVYSTLQLGAKVYIY